MRVDVCLCVSPMVCARVYEYVSLSVCGSQAVAVAVRERWLRGQLHHPSAATFADDLGGAAQKLLGFGESIGQLLLPLDKLWVTLYTHTHTHRETRPHSLNHISTQT